ncbi:hypothetical protein [Bartonella tribocorum]|uniref:Uncharacterized protein n=1 Tax=Bartonella tribocorum TaxID=85701 RepID=A0A2M6UUF9_9HYPH|nr:hypothetical protein [Bartonella tribocorum]PIT69830.1 hypothetical protein CER18_02115 [Bartonella tribocorum]
MKDSFRHRIIFILFVFFIFSASLFVSRSGAVSQFFFSHSSFSSQKIDVTEGFFLERLSVSFPDIITHLSKMSPQQQELFIVYLRRDAVSFASELGQSCEEAHKFGEAVAMAFSKAMSRPSILDSYF